VHMSIGGWRIKTVPSRLSAVDLARLRNAGAKTAGPPPAGHAPGVLAAASCVEVQRLVNSAGIITLGGQAIQVGSPLAGQRARIRLDGQVMHVITQGGILWRTLACPIPPDQRHRIQGVRLAGPDPLPAARLTVQRTVSSRGGIQVARQRMSALATQARPWQPDSAIPRCGSSTSTASWSRSFPQQHGRDQQVQGLRQPSPDRGSARPVSGRRRA